MEFNHDMIKKEPLYKEETIRHAARLDEEERRALILNSL